MSATQTTLNGTMSDQAITLVLTAYTAPATGTGVNSGNKVLRVDGEWMRITDDSLAPSLKVTRGEFGTGAKTHRNLATVVYGLTTDMQQLNDIEGANVTSYSASGAIGLPLRQSNVEQLVFFNGGSAQSMTLAAPPVDQDGLLLVFTSNTAFAHVITATGLINDGSTTVNVATFAAHPGASVTFQASRGKWNVISSTAITFS